MKTESDPRMLISCENCKFWDNSIQLAGAETDTTGACRVNPPVADDRTGQARWPCSQDDDWCAAFKMEGSAEEVK
jgi:hypothetical protein